MRINRLTKILTWIFILYTLHTTLYASTAFCASKGNYPVTKHVIARSEATKQSLRLLRSLRSLAMTVDNWLCPNVYAASKGNPPVAYWRFDEGGGPTAYDESTNNNDGTLTAGAGGTNTAVGQMWTRQGKISGALELDGTDDYVSLGNVPATLTEGTIEIWFNRRTSKSGYQMLFTDAGSQFEICYNTDTLRFYVDNVAVNTTSANNNGTWQHVTGTFSQTGNYKRLYLNGVLVGSGTYTGDATVAARYIGSRIGSYPFDGFIDDVKVYNYARTADQILVDYNAGAAAYSGAGTDPNEGNPPVGYWKFDENTGTTAYDRSGNGNNGTLTNGPTWAQGKYGSALSFDGSDDYVYTQDIDTLNNFTYEAWVKLSAVPTGKNTIFNKEIGGLLWPSVRLYVNSDSTVGFDFYKSSSTQQVVTTTDKLVIDGWYYLVGVYNGSKLQIYINGVFSKEADASGTPNDINNELTIGAQEYNSVPYFRSVFKGLIDDVKIYNYARTQAQIAYDYNKGKPMAHYKFDEGGGAISHNEYSSADSGAVSIGWWRFDAGTGTSCVDSSGNSLTATASAATWTSGKIGPYGLNNTLATVIDNSLLEGMSSLTMSAWVYPTVLEGGDRQIVDKGAWTDADMSYRLMYQTDWGSGTGYPNGYWRFHIKTSTGEYSAAGPNGVSADRKNMWHYIVGVLDGSAGKVRIYDNGILIGEGNASGTINANAYNMLIWRAASGIVDDVRIYNYARTAEQIYNDYKTSHGTLMGDTKFADGKVGKALELNGVNGYVLVPHSTSLNHDGNYTITAWFYLDTWTNYNAVLAKSDYPSNGPTQYQMQMSDAVNTKAIYSYGGGNGGIGTRVDSSANFCETGKWIFATITQEYNGTNTTIKFYKNGILYSSGTASGKTYNAVGNMSIGNDITDGKIDDVRIYNYVRTADQILQDYNAGMSSHSGASTGMADPWGGALPAGHWKLDENTGVLANDASGNGNNGTLGSVGYQPSWVNGKYGPALQFDGSDHVAIADAPAFSFTTGFTIEAWVYATSWVSPGGHNTIVGKENEFLLAVNNSGNLANYIWAGTGWTMDSNQPAMSLNRWVHMALIYDGSKIYSYLDGALQGTGTAKTGNMGDTANVLGIGKRDSASYQPFAAGKIDDVRMYNYARTQAQIAWDYNKGKPAGYWRFDEISGATCYDDSGNNNGTATIGGTGTQTTIAAARTNGATGKFGKCMSFDGTDDYVSCGNGASLNITNTVTIEAWIKANSWATTGGVSLGVFAWKSGAYGIAFNTSGSVGGIFYRTGGTPLYIMPSSGVLNTGQWYHVAGVYDGSNAYTYVDGKLVNSASYSGTLVSNSNNLMIGGFTTDRHFNGFVDDARVYNYTRTADQILQDYNQGLAAKMGE